MRLPSKVMLSATGLMPLIASQKSDALAPSNEITRRDAIERPARPVGGERAGHDRERERQTHGDAGEFEGGRHRLQHHLERRTALADGFAEIARAEIGEEAAELHDQRIVEPVFRPELLPGLDRGVDGKIEIGRIAGKPGEEEHGHDQPGEGYQALQRAPCDEAPHRLPTA